MHCINKRYKYLILSILPALVWLITNATVNTHTHILTGDIEISHAHPYNKNAGETNPEHHHNKGEFILLDLISHPLVLLVFFLFGLFPGTIIRKVVFYFNATFTVKEHYYVLNYHAPPAQYF